MKKFIFDIDGTLTPSRGIIDKKFLKFMLSFADKHDVYFVTGSDKDKTLEQIGKKLLNKAKRVYNCSGADVYEGDFNTYRVNWELPEEVERFLQDELDFSQFPIRNGNHIERRPGGINFSILGRDKDPSIGRKDYIWWDKIHSERMFIAARIINQFPKLNVQIGGQTGLDISNKDKSQILRDFGMGVEIHFFGDMMKDGENDYPLAKAVQEMGGYAHCVKDWKDTKVQINNVVAFGDNKTQTRLIRS